MIKIFNIIFKFDIMIMYIFLQPMMRLDEFTLENSLKNYVKNQHMEKKEEYLGGEIILIGYGVVTQEEQQC